MWRGTEEGSAVPSGGDKSHDEVKRVVLWFHHIKSVQKRKNLVGFARELDLVIVGLRCAVSLSLSLSQQLAIQKKMTVDIYKTHSCCSILQRL